MGATWTGITKEWEAAPIDTFSAGGGSAILAADGDRVVSYSPTTANDIVGALLLGSS